MYIRSIEKESNSENHLTLVDTLLSQGIHSDGIFENTFIKIEIEDARVAIDSLNQLYRLLWENNYIKLQSTNRSSDITRTWHQLVITLSEAIGFIYKATPPILQKDIPDSIRSYDNIIELLKTFLMDKKSPEYVHYLDLFFSHVRYKPFETQWNLKPQQEKANMLYEFKDRISPILYIIYSTADVMRMFSPMTDHVYMYGMLVADKTTIDDALCFITDYDFHVDNIHIENGLTYITIWHDQLTVDSDVCDLIKTSYKSIM